MRKIKYTKSTLEKFTLKELQKICTYYDIQFLPSWSKARLVKEILTYSPPELIGKTYNDSRSYSYSPVIELPHVEPKKSVRIQRIKDGKEK